MRLWEKWKERRAFARLARKRRRARKRAGIPFPGGDRQIRAAAEELREMLGHSVSAEEAREILVHAKFRIILGFGRRLEPTSLEALESRLVESIRVSSEGKLSRDDAKKVYYFVLQSVEESQPEASFAGDSSPFDRISARPDKVIKIDARTSSIGIPMEYRWLEDEFGEQDRDWVILDRVHGMADDGNAYEIFSIQLKKHGKRVVAFEISSFYGK